MARCASLPSGFMGAISGSMVPCRRRSLAGARVRLRRVPPIGTLGAGDAGAATALIDDDEARQLVEEDGDLLKGLCQRVAVRELAGNDRKGPPPLIVKVMPSLPRNSKRTRPLPLEKVSTAGSCRAQILPRLLAVWVRSRDVSSSAWHPFALSGPSGRWDGE